MYITSTGGFTIAKLMRCGMSWRKVNKDMCKFVKNLKKK